MSNLSFGSGDWGTASLHRLTCPRQHPFRGRAPGPVSSQLSSNDGLEEPFKVVLVSCRLSPTGIRFLDILFPPKISAFLTVGLPDRRPDGPDSVGVSVFRTHETRLGLGAPCTPGTVVSTRPHTILGRHPPPSNGRSLSPWSRKPSQDVQLTRHQRGFTGIHPIPSLPLACGPRTEREPLGFPVSFAPDQLLAAAVTHVTAGTGLRH